MARKMFGSNGFYLPSRELTYPPTKAFLKMIFLFPRWDMLVPWRVYEMVSLTPLQLQVSPDT